MTRIMNDPNYDYGPELKYAVSTPPFVNRQQITLNIPTMDNFDRITNDFANAIGVVQKKTAERQTTTRSTTTSTPSFSRPIQQTVVKSPTPITRGGNGPTVRPTPVAIPYMPPVSTGPVMSGGGGGGGGETAPEQGAGDSGAKEEVSASHGKHYIIGAVVGAIAGYFIAKKYNKNVWGGAGIGVGGVLAIEWVWFNKGNLIKPVPAPSTTPPTT